MRHIAKRLGLGMAVLGLLVGSAATARADLMFNATGAFDNGAQLSGLVMINTAAGIVTSADLTLSMPGLPGVSFQSINAQGDNAPYGHYSFTMNPTHGDTSILLGLVVESPTLVGYQGGALVPAALDPPGQSQVSTYYYDSETYQECDLTVGALIAVPEPSTLAIAGLSGAIWLCYAWRRRNKVSASATSRADLG